jgi:hypothetical protein
LQSELSLTQLRLRDSEAEKDMYFSKLAQLDQFLSEAVQGNQGNDQIVACLSQIQQIIM